MPERLFVSGRIGFAKPARAVADAARLLTRFNDVRAVVCEAVQRRAGLPTPMFNARLFDADGVFIAMVDAWWADAGVAAEVDSRAYHLSAEDQDHTSERHDRLAAHGILPLHFSPKRIKADPAGVIRDLRDAIEQGLRRQPLPISALPSAS